MKKILIVDDEPNIRRLLQYNLGENFEVVSASNGEEALAELQKQRPDLIVTDVSMPNLDGFDFLKKVRSNDLLKHIPVIFLSARGQSMDKIKGLKMGADDYITKPFNPEELEIRINSLLRRTDATTKNA